MPFGITSASEVFQRAMEELFAGYPCAIIVDDLLVWSEGTADHDVNLKKVLERTREVGVKLALKKCKFRLNQVSYVGHQFTNCGLKPDEARVAAIKEMPTPDGPEALRRFLGMTNYLHKFISNFSEKTAPLHELLRNDAHWSWKPAQQQAFDALKANISQPPVLRYFDPSKPVCRCLKEWSWCCVLTGWLPCGLCLTSPNGGRNSICANREGAAFYHICMQKVPRFHLWSASYYRDRSQASHSNRKQAFSFSPRSFSAYAFAASEV